MFVIRRINNGGGYVAKLGHKSSYVKNLEFARKFRTRQEAERDRCPTNEVVEDLERILDRIRV